MRAFTLLEVLVSLLIFLIAMVAVASLFPVAVSLQRNAAMDVNAQQAGRSGRALVEALNLTTDRLLAAGADQDGLVYSVGLLGPRDSTQADHTLRTFARWDGAGWLIYLAVSRTEVLPRAKDAWWDAAAPLEERTRLVLEDGQLIAPRLRPGDFVIDPVGAVQVVEGHEGSEIRIRGFVAGAPHDDPVPNVIWHFPAGACRSILVVPVGVGVAS